MRVIRVGHVYRASRITGPKHNFLGMSLSDTQPSALEIVRRSINNEPPVLDEELVVRSARRGIENATIAANAQPLYPTMIEYVESDSPDYSAYELLAAAIMNAALSDR